MVGYALLVGGMAGCSGGGSGAGTVVKGKVTLDGTAVDKAVLQFFPPSGNTSLFSSNTKEDGTFESTLAADTKYDEGTYRVTVVKYDKKKDGKSKVNTEGMDMDQLKMMGLAINTLPKKYESDGSTPLKAEIKKGTVDVEFALKSK